MNWRTFLAQPKPEPKVEVKPPLIIRDTAFVTDVPPRIFCHVPAQKWDVINYTEESIKLASGTCPLCGFELKHQIDLMQAKVFYQCQGNVYHFFVRPAMG